MNLNQVTLPATDVQASVAFYAGMGFTLVVDAAPRYARFLCPQGGATFSVHAVPGPVHSEGVTTYFECADVDAEHRRLLALGYRFSQPPTDEPWRWREARLADPAGNVLCLYHAGENRVNPPWRVGAPADR